MQILIGLSIQPFNSFISYFSNSSANGSGCALKVTNWMDPELPKPKLLLALSECLTWKTYKIYTHLGLMTSITLKIVHDCSFTTELGQSTEPIYAIYSKKLWFQNIQNRKNNQPLLPHPTAKELSGRNQYMVQNVIFFSPDLWGWLHWTRCILLYFNLVGWLVGIPQKHKSERFLLLKHVASLSSSSLISLCSSGCRPLDTRPCCMDIYVLTYILFTLEHLYATFRPIKLIQIK